MTRTPQPDDWLNARDVAEIRGWPVRRAENVVRAIARRHGGPLRDDGVRGVYILRRWLEESQSSVSS